MDNGIQPYTISPEAYTNSTPNNGDNGFLKVTAIAIAVIVGLGTLINLIKHYFVNSNDNSVTFNNHVLQDVERKETQTIPLYYCARSYTREKDHTKMTRNLDGIKLIYNDPRDCGYKMTCVSTKVYVEVSQTQGDKYTIKFIKQIKVGNDICKRIQRIFRRNHETYAWLDSSPSKKWVQDHDLNSLPVGILDYYVKEFEENLPYQSFLASFFNW